MRTKPVLLSMAITAFCIFSTNAFSLSFLLSAASRGITSSFKMAMKEGAKIDQVDADGKGALAHAILNEQVKFLKWVLGVGEQEESKIGPLNLPKKDTERMLMAHTPGYGNFLHMAAAHCKPDMLELIFQNLPLESRNEYLNEVHYDRTPLQMAIDAGKLENVFWILRRNLDSSYDHLRDQSRQKPLDRDAFKSEFEQLVSHMQ